jgi:hypothetical protein
MRHNSNIVKIIAFIRIIVMRDDFEITGGGIDDLIQPLDRSNFDDVEALLTKQPKDGPKVYREEEIVYKNINFKLISAYICEKEQKYHMKDGVIKMTDDNLPKVKSHDSHRKICNALTYGAEAAKQGLGDEYKIEEKTFLSSLRNELSEKKAKGQLEEREADPLPFSLFYKLCEWAVEKGFFLLWAMALLQWHCMARCQNIDNLSFRNFSLGEDSLKIKFFFTKKDQGGKRCTPKNCYANPFKPTICLYLALGCYLCFVSNGWTEDRRYIFIHQGAKAKSASSRYTDKIKAWVKEKTSLIEDYLRPKHVNPYSVRKGPATHATSNTTSGPPLPSLFHRGEWSMGVVLDIYWQFAEVGDHYLGRILSGLDPHKASFNVLPPHFTVSEHEAITKGMHLCFGNIICAHQDSDTQCLSVLKRLLASIVYHHKFLIETMARYPGHQFNNIALLKDPDLLKELFKLVTMAPTLGICEVPTGTPPHTEVLTKVEKIVSIIGSLRDELDCERTERMNAFKSMAEEIATTVVNRIEDRDVENGNLTAEGVKLLFSKHEERVTGIIKDTAAEAVKATLLQLGITPGGDNIHGTADAAGGLGQLANISSGINYRSYVHQGGTKQYHVPFGYRLPKQCNLDTAFSMYVNGDPTHKSIIANESSNENMTNTPIRPLYYWNKQSVPTELWTKFKVGWRPILELMMRAQNLKDQLPVLIKSNGGRIPFITIEGKYKEGIDHVFKEITYLRSCAKVETWSVTYWSKKISRNEIIKCGTDADKGRLPQATFRNIARART